jgi:CBS domain-containing membrane protein
MREHRVHHLPVVDAKSRLLGLISMQDILRVELEHAEDSKVAVESELAMPVSRIMTQTIPTMSPMATIQDAIRQMLGVHHGCAPVVDDNRVLLGLVTEKDVLDRCERWLSKQSLSVGDIMTRELITAHNGMSLADAASLMDGARIHHLPVAGDHGELLGLVSHGDLLEHQRTSSNVPPKLRATQGIKDMARSQVWTTTQNTPAADAAQTLRDNPFSCLPVVEEGILMGILTATDLYRAFLGFLNRESATPPVDQYVASYLRQPVYWMSPAQTVDEAIALFSEQEISTVLIGSERDCLGLLSQSDLLHAFQNSQTKEAHADFRSLPVEKLMSRNLVTISARHRISSAARLLQLHKVHHLVVVEKQRAIGILRSADFLPAVRDSKSPVTLGELMTKMIFTLDSQEPVGTSIKYLRQSGLQSLMVHDQGCPIGMFGQREALASLTGASSCLVEGRMSPKILCLQSDLPVYRAAQQASALHVDQIVVMEGREVTGFVSATNFVGLLVRITGTHQVDERTEVRAQDFSSQMPTRH